MKPRTHGKSPIGGEIVRELMEEYPVEPSKLGATGIVPGGVSWTEPEKQRAAIELGNKRFGKGRKNG